MLAKKVCVMLSIFLKAVLRILFIESGCVSRIFVESGSDPVFEVTK
jgi:hypothetical protein